MELPFVETKIFDSGNSRAVRISRQFAIAKSDQVFIYENEDGSLLITDKPSTHTWSDFFQRLNQHQNELESFEISQDDRSLNQQEQNL